MRLGIIGLPQSGKTAIFNALTRGDQPTATGGGRFEVHTAVVDVPDPRLQRLTEIFEPKKSTHAQITYADIAGLDGSAGEAGISGQLLSTLQQMDGFLLVLRCFEDPNVAHPAGSLDPQRDLESMATELLLNDLIMVERKQQRLAEERQKGSRDRAQIDQEMAVFDRLQAALEAGQPLRELQLDPEAERIISGYGFLTRKPLMLVYNLGEGQAAPGSAAGNLSSVALQGRLEMEIAQLAAEEAALFMQEYGIDELSLYRMIRHSYDLLGVQSIFTGDEKEVRAWTVRRGATAPEAAGAIHTDFQKGFIRAEVVPFTELDAVGSLAAARSAGKLRIEGKSYIVQDGDVIRIRFNL